MEIDGHQIKTTHLTKVLFPDDGITKGDIIHYYRQVAASLLPHLHERPLSIQRFLNGITGPSFYQKAVPPYYPAWIARVEVPKKEGGVLCEAVCENTAMLASAPKSTRMSMTGNWRMVCYLQYVQYCHSPEAYYTKARQRNCRRSTNSAQ